MRNPLAPSPLTSDDPMADPARLAAFGERVRTALDANPQAQRLGGEKVDIYLLPDLLTRKDCKRLLRTVDSRIGPSDLFKGTQVDGFRTSSTHYFDREDEATRELEQRLDDTLGIDHRHAEVPQGQRYRTGQQFRHHFDYFTTDRAYWPQERQRGGQRTWTAMLALNEPKEGGETDFPHLGFRFRPRTGRLLVWNNMDRGGQPNMKTLHAALPVQRGIKHVVTVWFREGPWRLLDG